MTRLCVPFSSHIMSFNPHIESTCGPQDMGRGHGKGNSQSEIGLMNLEINLYLIITL